MHNKHSGRGSRMISQWHPASVVQQWQPSVELNALAGGRGSDEVEPMQCMVAFPQVVFVHRRLMLSAFTYMPSVYSALHCDAPPHASMAIVRCPMGLKGAACHAVLKRPPLLWL